MKKPTQGISVRENITYSMGALGREVSANVVNVFCMLYLTAIQGLDGIVIGVCFCLAKVWDAINDPIVATFVNNTNSKHGRFRPWIFFGTLLNCLALVMLFAPFNFQTDGAKYFYYIFLYILWGMTYTLVDVPFWSMIPSIAKTTHERNKVTSLAKLVGGFGGFTISTVGTLLTKSTYGQYNPKSYTVVAAVGCGLFIVMMGVMLLSNREKYVLPNTKLKFREIFGLFKTNDQLQAYAVSFILFSIGSTISLFQIVYLFYYEPGLSLELYGLFCAVACTGQGIAMFFYPWITKKIPREKIYGLNYFLAIIGMLGLYFIFFFVGDSKVLNVIIVSLAGSFLMTANGLNQIGSTVMISDVVDYGEYVSGIRSDSIIFSIQTLFTKFAGALATLILGFGVRLARLPEIDPITETFVGEVTGGMMTTLRGFMFLVPVPLMILGYIVYKRKYNLYGEKYENVVKVIEERRAVAEKETKITEDIK